MKKKWDPATEGEAYKLFLLLNQTADGLRKLRQRSLENCGITMEQAAALICVKRLGENATSAELSKWLFREPNTVWMRSVLPTWEKHGARHIGSWFSGDGKEILRLLEFKSGADFEAHRAAMSSTETGRQVAAALSGFSFHAETTLLCYRVP